MEAPKMFTTLIPFIKDPNSKFQIFTHSRDQRLSDFQISTLKKISERKDFHYFVLLQHNQKDWIVYDGADCKPGPFLISWYNLKGQMVTIKLGQKKILSEITSNEQEPITKDSYAYISRLRSFS
jgi:hypothetical protein